MELYGLADRSHLSTAPVDSTIVCRDDRGVAFDGRSLGYVRFAMFRCKGPDQWRRT